jgi:hypothetical protein
MKTHTPAIACLALSAVLYGCQQRSTENAPITTTSPAGQSTAPSSAAADRRDDALVRFVHAIPSKVVVDLYADDDRTFDGVAFRAVTPYREVNGERYTFKLRQAGTASAPLATNKEGLNDGDYYTVFAVPGDHGAAMLRVVEDDFSAPAEGKARVRVVHASGDIGELAVFERGRDTSLFGGVDFQSVTRYDEVDAWQGPLDIKPEGGDSVLVTIPDAAFEAGKVYTVVIVGNSRTSPKIDAFVIEDRPGVPAQASAQLGR